MGLMRGAIEFGQREHIQDATTSKDIGLSLDNPCHATARNQCPLLLSGIIHQEMGRTYHYV